MDEVTEKPKYVGYGYHGGGRKKGSGIVGADQGVLSACFRYSQRHDVL